MTDHFTLAENQLIKAGASRQQLTAELERPARDRTEVDRLSSQYRDQLATARVHALLSISQRLDDRRLVQ